MPTAQELERRTGVPAAVWRAMGAREPQPIDRGPLGDAISLTNAARKYGISQSTLSGWVSYGLVRVIERNPRPAPTLIAERDVQNVAYVYKRQPGRGRRTAKKFAVA